MLLVERWIWGDSKYLEGGSIGVYEKYIVNKR